MYRETHVAITCVCVCVCVCVCLELLEAVLNVAPTCDVYVDRLIQEFKDKSKPTQSYSSDY
jgi:hypothetical protein